MIVPFRPGEALTVVRAGDLEWRVLRGPVVIRTFTGEDGEYAARMYAAGPILALQIPRLSGRQHDAEFELAVYELDKLFAWIFGTPPAAVPAPEPEYPIDPITDPEDRAILATFSQNADRWGIGTTDRAG